MVHLLRVLRRVLSSPLNQTNKFAALGRFFRWQVGSALVPGGVLVPWVNGSRIVTGYRMSGSAACAYTGLHEFEEMAFVFHFLRRGELFFDAGANVGVFTVLAGAAAGCSCVSVEPGEAAHAVLRDNVLVNRMTDRVETHQACLSDHPHTVRFVSSPDSGLSHVASAAETGGVIEIPATTIDSILGDRCPILMKMDVEGHEMAALKGASRLLDNPSFQALVLELGTCSLRYGIDPADTHRMICAHGFRPYAYEPFTRTLRELPSHDPRENTLYLRDVEFARRRLKEAEPIRVLHHVI
jgi:FkbM family methyltransferase